MKAEDLNTAIQRGLRVTTTYWSSKEFIRLDKDGRFLDENDKKISNQILGNFLGLVASKPETFKIWKEAKEVLINVAPYLVYDNVSSSMTQTFFENDDEFKRKTSYGHKFKRLNALEVTISVERFL